MNTGNWDALCLSPILLWFLVTGFDCLIKTLPQTHLLSNPLSFSSLCLFSPSSSPSFICVGVSLERLCPNWLQVRCVALDLQGCFGKGASAILIKCL